MERKVREHQTMTEAQPRRVVLFDGECNLCNASVRFIIDHDPHGRYKFAPLQSAAGRTLIRAHNLDADQLGSVVLIEGGAAHKKSDAALRIARGLGGAWSIVFALIFVPRFIRDAVYSFVARNRYRWFGKRDECMVPTPEMRGRFLP